MDINEIAAKHQDWVDRMGWHNTSGLESLALVASEVGESANECSGLTPTAAFGSELADIVLRVADIAHSHGIDLSAEITAKMALTESRVTRGRVF
jgi:NTP pyrophosphatase (non-canonical NTP hydrolase)